MVYSFNLHALEAVAGRFLSFQSSLIYIEKSQANTGNIVRPVSKKTKQNQNQPNEGQERETVKQLRGLAIFPEDQSFIPNIHMVTHSHL